MGRTPYLEGSRTLDAGSGYMRIKTANGWQYEHRVVMEQKLGRPLGKRERVYHLNDRFDDNRPENLSLTPRSKKAPTPPCVSCGCDPVTGVSPYDSEDDGKPRVIAWHDTPEHRARDREFAAAVRRMEERERDAFAASLKKTDD